MEEFSSPADAHSKSPRNSYTSTFSSPRNSYASISENAGSSARSSYSSIFDPPLRVASFSRTSDEFIPGSDSASISTTAGESVDEEIDEEAEVGEIKSKRWSGEIQAKENEEVKSHIRTGSKDGPSALKELENVKEIICVAFGAFDRYFISWEDMEGEFRQESHNLPTALHDWLFPTTTDAQTRDIPTLQVSFGSNDEFFASDKNGKISHRDSISPPPSQSQSHPQATNEKNFPPPPSLSSVARSLNFMRRKAYTVSSPSPSLPTLPEPNPTFSRIERRKTYLDSQTTSTPTSRIESNLQQQAFNPIREPGRSWTPKHERTQSIIAVSEGQLKRLSSGRRSTLVGERRSENSSIDLGQTQSNLTQDLEESCQEGQSHRSRSLERNIGGGGGGGGGVLPLELESGHEPRKQDHHWRRRSLLVSTLPVRVSWPDTTTVLQLRAKESIRRLTTTTNNENKKQNEIPSPPPSPAPKPKPRLLRPNAEIQTSASLATFPFEQGQAMQHQHPVGLEFECEHHIPIGLMSDFFRCQYRLGDALAFV
ncbi:hypothetical protein BKA64DRAFT_262515 [Cadophora sp. MPI-SDFR-AT-0126]|nr:hypothetical protein BKA64DRAFT_262515 [Leotiomycetes sp. MPI-SDFR-AT-0126]